MAIEKLLLSGSTNGKPILVTASASAGTLIHTAVSGTTQNDVITLYAYNLHTALVKLTIEFGGTSSSEQMIVPIPFQDGLVVAIPGIPLNNGLVVRAFSDNSGSKILITGHVLRGP